MSSDNSLFSIGLIYKNSMISAFSLKATVMFAQILDEFGSLY
jgi:hypothetical protein